MNIYEIRLANARALQAEAGGAAEFSKRVGRSEPQITNTIGPNPKKNIGYKMARDIEKCFGKPENWLDVPQTLSDVTRDELQELEEIYSNLTKQERRMYLKIGRGIRDK